MMAISVFHLTKSEVFCTREQQTSRANVFLCAILSVVLFVRSVLRFDLSRMVSSSSPSSAAVIVAGSALLAAASWGYFATSRRRAQRHRGGDIDAAAAAAAMPHNDNEITAAEVCEIYERLLSALQATCQDLVRQIAPYQPHLPRRELRKALATELERALRRHQRQLLSEKDIDLECFDDAVRDLMGHNQNWQVQQAVTKFQIFWRNCADDLFPTSTITGSSAPPVPPIDT